MAPNPHKLTLSKESFQQGANGDGSSGNTYPTEVRLVVSGSASGKAIDSLAVDWKANGFGKDRGKTKLAGIVYELGHGEKADPSLESFTVANEAPGFVPVTLIHPLVGGASQEFHPRDAAPPHVFISYSLPTINKAEDVQGDNEEKWLKMLKIASERSLTLEISVNSDEATREAVEKLLGKAWDEESERSKSEGKDVNTTGVRIIFENLASAPVTQPSSQLNRSPELEKWTDFIRRLALHPRVYMKLSPLPLPGFIPGSGTPTPRSADALGSSVSNLVANAVQGAAGLASTAIKQAEAIASPQDRKSEVLRRLRVFLDASLEAFGEERIVWAATMSSGSAMATKATRAAGNKEALSEVEEWFEICRESLTQTGLKGDSLDNIFSKNASVVYRM